MSAPWDVPITSVQPEDVIVGGDAHILVVSITPDEGWLVVRGRIVKGYGKSKRMRTWRYMPDMKVGLL